MKKEKIIKIVLITKNEKYLIKDWIQYHGEIFGYENLYIIDDSDDIEVLNYYKTLSNLPINFYFNKLNLNEVTNKINEVMYSIKNSCDFMIKVDTDEFIGLYDETKNDISINKEIIRNAFTNLIVNGLKYKCSYTIYSLPLDSKDNPLEYVYFSQPGGKTTFKTFFNSKTYLYCDLGSHVGTVIPRYEKDNKHNETNIIIIHYHNQNFDSYIDNCRKAIISHNYISLNDDKETQIRKLSEKFGPSCHKAEYYLRYLTDPDYPNSYYNSFINNPNKFKFEKLKNLFYS